MAQVYELKEPELVKPTYVRVRCPCCGMLTRLGNVVRDHRLLEEVDTFCGGRYPKSKNGIMRHLFKTNENLRGFWVKRLLRVLESLGYKIEYPKPYQLIGRPSFSYRLEEVKPYEIQEREIPYIAQT